MKPDKTLKTKKKPKCIIFCRIFNLFDRVFGPIRPRFWFCHQTLGTLFLTVALQSYFKRYEKHSKPFPKILFWEMLRSRKPIKGKSYENKRNSCRKHILVLMVWAFCG